MALDSAASWGAAIAAAVKALNIQAGEEITDAQLEQVWTTVKTEDRGQLTGNLQASAPAGGAAHAPGGVVPVIITPGEFS